MGYSVMDLGSAKHLVAAVTPQVRGAFREQAREVMSAVREALEKNRAMTAVAQTVFLRDPGDRAECERLLEAFYGARPPVISFVSQQPCSGAALAAEIWAIGGDHVRAEQTGLTGIGGQRAVAVSHGGLRWVWCEGSASAPAGDAYGQTLSVLGQMRAALEGAGTGFGHVVRTWFYLGGITEPEAGSQRYEHLNRSRSDFYSGIRFHPSLDAVLVRDQAVRDQAGRGRVFPASTGIGMAGGGLAAGCMALEFSDGETALLPLENPLQTPAYDYHCGCSAQSPEFSRAMALLHGDTVMIWISGTASIVRAESLHPEDVEKQTEQTIENIEKLISRENFALHGAEGAGASLSDLAAVRVYVKRPEDFDRCRAVCERLLSGVPAIYTVADVCRPELLVEIEAVAFSRRLP